MSEVLALLDKLIRKSSSLGKKFEPVPLSALSGKHIIFYVVDTEHLDRSLVDKLKHIQDIVKPPPIVIVTPYDCDESEYMDYFATLPATFLGVSFESEKKDALIEELTFGVADEIALVVCSPDGQILTRNGSDALGVDLDGRRFPWRETPLQNFELFPRDLVNYPCVVAFPQTPAETTGAVRTLDSIAQAEFTEMQTFVKEESRAAFEEMSNQIAAAIGEGLAEEVRDAELALQGRAIKPCAPPAPTSTADLAVCGRAIPSSLPVTHTPDIASLTISGRALPKTKPAAGRKPAGPLAPADIAEEEYARDGDAEGAEVAPPADDEEEGPCRMEGAGDGDVDIVAGGETEAPHGEECPEDEEGGMEGGMAEGAINLDDDEEEKAQLRRFVKFFVIEPQGGPHSEPLSRWFASTVLPSLPPASRQPGHAPLVLFHGEEWFAYEGPVPPTPDALRGWIGRFKEWKLRPVKSAEIPASLLPK